MNSPRPRAWWIGLSLLCSLASCGGLGVTKEEFPRLFSVGKDGRSCVTSLDGDSLNDRDFKLQLSSASQELAAYVSGDGKRILLYFHGGMNGVAKGADNARDVLERISADRKANIHAIAVNWNSGYSESLGHGLFQTIRGAKSNWYAPISAPFRIFAGVGRAVTRLPYTLGWQGVQNVRQAGGVGIVPPEASLQTFPASAGFNKRMAANGPGFGLMRNLISPVIPGAFRVISTPALDASGPTAYADMRRTVNQAFVKDDAEMTPLANWSERKTAYSRGLMDLLAEEISKAVSAANKGVAWKSQVKVTVAAHSMGAHVANELLFRHPELPVDEIIFLAPACSTREFAYSTLPYIQSRLDDHQECNFYCLMLHPERETKERSGWGFAPEGSLLVWVDDYLTEHYSDLDATMGQWNNAMNAVPQLRLLATESSGQLLKALHFRMFDWAEDDENCGFGHAKTHGQVDDVDFWTARVKWPPSVAKAKH